MAGCPDGMIPGPGGKGCINAPSKNMGGKFHAGGSPQGQGITSAIHSAQNMGYKPDITDVMHMNNHILHSPCSDAPCPSYNNRNSCNGDDCCSWTTYWNHPDCNAGPYGGGSPYGGNNNCPGHCGYIFGTYPRPGEARKGGKFRKGGRTKPRPRRKMHSGGHMHKMDPKVVDHMHLAYQTLPGQEGSWLRTSPSVDYNNEMIGPMGRYRTQMDSARGVIGNRTMRRGGRPKLHVPKRPVSKKSRGGNVRRRRR